MRQVTGDGHGHREYRNRPFGHRELAPGFRRLKAERLAPDRLTTVAVTRHLRVIGDYPQGFSFNFSILAPGRPRRHSPTLRRLRSVASWLAGVARGWPK